MSTLITAEIVTDSMHPTSGVRCTTWQLNYPRFVHAELMTHRVFSRNSASSRAIPAMTLIGMVEENPVVPIHWGKNQKGMQADVEVNFEDSRQAESVWLQARDNAIASAKELVDIGIHKQIANRLIEPFMHITVIVTATKFRNWFKLRNNPMAEPHIAKLAFEMDKVYHAATPTTLKIGQWHLPFVDANDWECQLSTDTLVRKSVARCARGSYLQQRGNFTIDEDMKLCNTLETSGHWSPFEHQAAASPLAKETSGNFHGGWLQYRKTFGGEHGGD